ncbi:MAG: 9-O-acetylesterase [Armatimonadetes bacterium]|nr:9-O-acetylesterase [Armatimonadota bacterium]
MTLSILVLALAPASAQSPLPFLNPIFSDHMVLQRGMPNTFWGWAKPGSKVSITIAGKNASGTTGADGKWVVKVTPPPVGGPYKVAVVGEQKVVLDDVLVGDVWICSGQSNMEQGIAACLNPKNEIAAANYPKIRLAMVPKVTAFDPQPTVPTGWSVCSPETIDKGGWGGFSGVAYFFGRELHKRLDVPIGLVEDCWGGTIIEAWASRASVTKQGDFGALLDQIDRQKANMGEPFEKQVEAWNAKAEGASKVAAGWEKPEFDAQGWKSIDRPKRFEDMGLEAFDGFGFYRAEIDVPAGASGTATLSLGAIDDADVTYVNGVRVGSMSVWDAARRYTVPAGTLKPGKNVIAVRVLDTGGAGGFTSAVADMGITFSDGTKAPLSQGKWRFQAGAAMSALPPYPQQVSGNPNVPTVLYNAMIHPIVPLAIKGAIWYQGESNAGRAYQYRELMPMLINDWRRLFGQPNLPFFIVQLANFTARLPDPGESDWAELREAQFMATQKLKNVGIGTAIDIGEANDIHPRNKQDVGYRLALSALKVAYRQNVSYSGPTYKSMKVEGNTIRLKFNHTDGGLKGLAYWLKGFSIAGKDRKFVWADARIDGDTVVVSSPQIREPVAVRYAWATNPEVSLYNGAGLPAFPFRTDDWKGVTFGRK